jgi:hypothetical protein
MLEHAFPNTSRNVWDKEKSLAAYMTILSHVDPGAVLIAVRKLAITTGGKWRPSAGEILAELEEDPEQPTFEDLIDALWGSLRVLKALPPRQGAVTVWASEQERMVAQEAAVLQRAEEKAHPLIVNFIAHYGVRKLLNTDIAGEYGWKRREEVQEAWERFVEQKEGVAAHQIAGGRRNEMGQLEPLKSLGLEQGQLTR